MEKAIKRYFPIFLLPTLAAFTIGFIVPFLMGIWLSFCKFTTVTDATFNGVENYVRAFQDTIFRHAFWYTALFAVVSLVVINIIAFLIALALTQKMRGTNIFRTVFFMPNLIGGIVLGYIWSMIFDGILIKYNTSVILETKYGFWGLVILVCWQQIGYMMIIYIAGIQNIPGDLIEAAKIDGASEWKVFLKIVMPNVKPAWLTLIIFSVQNLWNNRASTYIYTEKRKTLVYALQQIQSGGVARTGQMAAVSVIVMIVPIIVFVLSQSQVLETMASSGIKE